VEHYDRVLGAEVSADEAAADLLEYDGGGRGGVVDEGDAIDVVGIDEVRDGGA